MLYIGYFSFSDIAAPDQERTTFNLIVEALSGKDAEKKFHDQLPEIRRMTGVFSKEAHGTIFLDGIAEVSEPPQAPVLIHEFRAVYRSAMESSRYCVVPDGQIGGVNECEVENEDFEPFYEVEAIPSPTEATK